MRGLYSRIFALLLVHAALLPGAGAAGLPATIGYEGFLKNASGDPINALVSLTFRLYGQSAGGSALWTETHNAVSVSEGVFSAQLGSIVSLVDTPGLSLNKALYLSIEVNTDGEMTPRLALNSAPYSFSTRKLSLEIAVDCAGGDTIGKALDDAPVGGALTLDVSGTCVEDVVITRSNMTIKSTSADAVIRAVSPAPNACRAALHIHGARNVTVSDISILPDPADTENMRGVCVSDNAAAQLNSITVDGFASQGVYVHEGSALDMHSSIVRNNGSYGFLVNYGSNTEIRATSVTGNARGLFVESASAQVFEGSVVSGNTRHGVQGRLGSTIFVDSSTIENNGSPGSGTSAYGVLLTDNSSVQIKNSTVATGMQHAGEGASIGAYRNTNVYLGGGNTISAPFAATIECPPDCDDLYGAGGGGTAIDMEYQGSLRQQDGKDIIVGNIYTWNTSIVDFRDAEITPTTAVLNQGTFAQLRLRDRSPGDNTATLTGVLVANSQILSIRNSNSSERALIDGKVYCAGFGYADPDLAFKDPEDGFVFCDHPDLDIEVLASGPGSVAPFGTATHSITINNLAASSPRVDPGPITVYVQASGDFHTITVPSVANMDCSYDSVDTLTCVGPAFAWGDLTALNFDVDVVAGNLNSGSIYVDVWAYVDNQLYEDDESDNDPAVIETFVTN